MDCGFSHMPIVYSDESGYAYKHVSAPLHEQELLGSYYQLNVPRPQFSQYTDDISSVQQPDIPKFLFACVLVAWGRLRQDFQRKWSTRNT